MVWRIFGDLVLLLHLLFILFVLVGGFFALRWRWLPWVHLPTMAWAATLEFLGWICPLTPLENWFRRASGEAGYPGGFIEHYLLSLIYPSGLTPQIQTYLGITVVAVNALAYGLVWWRHKQAP